MSKVHQFNFEKTYKELDINGKIYRIETNDEAQARYRRAYRKFQESAEQLLANAPDLETCSDEEYEGYQKKQREISKLNIDAFLGDGAFEEVYEMAGRSLLNVAPLVEYISNMIITDEQLQKAQQYLKNGKRK